MMSHGDGRDRFLSPWKCHIFKDGYNDPPICDLLQERGNSIVEIYPDFHSEFFTASLLS